MMHVAIFEVFTVLSNSFLHHVFIQPQPSYAVPYILTFFCTFNSFAPLYQASQYQHQTNQTSTYAIPAAEQSSIGLAKHTILSACLTLMHVLYISIRYMLLLVNLIINS
jgi:hypothetical protein